MKKNLIGLMVMILSAQSSMAATLHCGVWKSSEGLPKEWDLSISPYDGAKQKVLVGTFNGMQVFADVLSYGNRMPELPASVSIYVIANGTRIDGGNRLLLSTSDKQVMDVQCSIEKR
jgi:hypothetical protein